MWLLMCFVWYYWCKQDKDTEATLPPSGWKLIYIFLKSDEDKKILLFLWIYVF